MTYDAPTYVAEIPDAGLDLGCYLSIGEAVAVAKAETYPTERWEVTDDEYQIVAAGTGKRQTR